MSIRALAISRRYIFFVELPHFAVGNQCMNFVDNSSLGEMVAKNFIEVLSATQIGKRSL